MRRRRWGLVIAVVLAAGSGGSHEASPPPSSAPPSAAPPTSVAAPTTTVAPPPTSTPPRARPTAADRARAHERLADGRRLESTGDHVGAIAALDEALAILPGDPRLLCEAGFIAYEAGETMRAGIRIDAALSAFGPPSALRGHARVAYAQCLYNRGLVAEQETDPVGAASCYARSLALRPNATVQAHLDAVRAQTRAPSSGETMGGIAVDVGDYDLFLHTRDRTQLLSSVEMGFGRGDGGETRPRARVSVLGERDDVIVLGVQTWDTMYLLDEYEIAHREPEGFRIALGPTEGARVEEEGSLLQHSSARIAHDGPYLRIEIDVREGYLVWDPDDASVGSNEWGCSEVAYSDSTRTVLCRTEPTLACLAAGVTTAIGPRRIGWSGGHCEDDTGHEVPPPAASTDTSGYARYAVTVMPDGRITITQTQGDPFRTEITGTHTFDELVASYALSGDSADGHTDDPEVRVVDDEDETSDDEE